MALKLLSDMEQSDGEGKGPPQEKAVILTGLGQKKRAVTYLEQAYQEHLSTLNGLKTDPLFDDLRSEPKFLNLLRQMNLN